MYMKQAQQVCNYVNINLSFIPSLIYLLKLSGTYEELLSTGSVSNSLG